MIHINFQPEYILKFGNIFLSNTIITSFLVTGILIILSLISYIFKKRSKNFLISKGIKIIIFELLKIIDSITGKRSISKKILPIVATFFLFIISANLLALMPGFLGSLFVKTPKGNFPLLRSPNSDLNTTLALAIFSVVYIQFFSISVLGIKKYISKFLNISSPIKFILGFFELISEATKILSFSFRLFGNIFGGEVLLIIIAFLVPYILPVPFMILEVFVGIIQAFIFAMLTLTFIKTSIVLH
ncbi:F0F1 ATP synthase subunit A [bacterium]|nr:F0F1 ATP synthase subunit A [bacterium]